MRLLFEIDKKDYREDGTVCIRPSVRGIIRKEGKLAMIYSRKYNYYKFPGGGIEQGESHEDTLIREVKEESGLDVIRESIEPYGYAHRVQKGKTEEKLFRIISIIYVMPERNRESSSLTIMKMRNSLLWCM